jgi:ribosome-associated protein
MSEAPEAGPERESAVAGRRASSPDGSVGLTRQIASIAASKLGEDLVALDVRSLVGYTDFLLICTARNERQAKAIHDEVYAQLKREGRLPSQVEGAAEGRWVLMDYLDCILHVFVPEMRDRYRLETLWGEAERLKLENDAG